MKFSSGSIILTTYFHGNTESFNKKIEEELVEMF